MLIRLVDPYRALPVSGNKSSMVNHGDMVTAHAGLPLMGELTGNKPSLVLFLLEHDKQC